MLNKLKKYNLFWKAAGAAGSLAPERLFQRPPKRIIVEPTNACNLRCPVCPTHFAMKRERGVMDMETFRAVINAFENEKAKPLIAMSFAGEPLLNASLPEFVDYASLNGHPTYISTNATGMTEDLALKLNRAGLTWISLCIDGFTKEAQEAYRVGSDFDEVKANIETFLTIRNQLNSRTKVNIQSLLTSFSEHQVDDLAQWAESLGADQATMKSLSMGSYTTPGQREKYSYLLPRNPELRRKQTDVKRTLCRNPLDDAVVFWNGNLGLCCVDFDARLNLPNIKEKGFLKTFLSPEMTQARRTGFLKKHPICRTCSLGNSDFGGLTFRFSGASDKNLPE